MIDRIDVDTRLFGLWTVVKDSSSALRALRATQYVAFYLTFSGVLQLVLLLVIGRTLVSSPPPGGSQFYAEFAIGLSFSALVLWLGLRIRNGKYGAVPYVCALLLLDVVFNLFEAPWVGVIGAGIFCAIALCGLKAWIWRKKYGILGESGRRNWLPICFGAISSVVFVSALGVVLLIGFGISPGTRVITGHEMPRYQIEVLLDRQILGRNDEIELFYSEGPFSVATGGQFMTSEKLVAYEELDGELHIYEMPYPEIESVELESQGGLLADSLYTVYGKPDAGWEWIIIILSVENGGDQRFIDRLEQHMADT